MGFWSKAFTLFLAALVIWGFFRACTSRSLGAPSVYNIGIDPSWYPMSLYGKDQSFTAFSTALLREIGQNQKIKFSIIRSGPKQLFELLDDGIVNGVLTSEKERVNEDLYYFSEPYYRLGAVFIVRKNFDFHSLKSLPYARIGIKRGSSILYYITIDPSISIQPYDSPLIALDQLIRGDLDGIVMNELLAYLYFGGLYRDKLTIATAPLTMEGLRLATLKDRRGKDLIEKFNIGLKNLIQNGTYAELIKEWDLYNTETQ